MSLLEIKNILATIDESGNLTGIGRAPRVAIIHMKDGKAEDSEYIDVKWGESHETEQEGMHHANIAKFIIANKINEVIAGGAGPDMCNMLEKLGLTVRIESGNYKDFIK